MFLCWQIDGVDKRTVSGHKKDSLEEIARLRMEVARLEARGRDSDSD